MNFQGLLFCACTTLGMCAYAQPLEPWCGTSNQEKLSQLDLSVVSGSFRVLYASSGDHAPLQAKDVNRNGIPDHIDDVLTQLQTAQYIFESVWGLPSPLKESRHNGRLTYIDVPILSIEGKTGVAYSSVRAYPLHINHEKNLCNLRIDLAKQLVRHTATPVHELFHLYQYGQSQIKVRWYLEGMARWSESALTKSKKITSRLPNSAPAIEATMGGSYDAAAFWQRLGELLDNNGHMELPPDVAHRRYADGRMVFQDTLFQGAELIPLILQKLRRSEKSVSEQMGWHKQGWTEAQKFSPALSKHVLTSTIDAFCQLAGKNILQKPEVREFIASAALLQIPIVKCN